MNFKEWFEQHMQSRIACNKWMEEQIKANNTGGGLIWSNQMALYHEDTNSIQADKVFIQYSDLIFYKDQSVVLDALNAINAELRKRPLHEPFPELYFSELPPVELIKASFSSMDVDQVVLNTFVKTSERELSPLQVPASLVSIISLYAFESFTTRLIKHLGSPSSRIQVAAFETVKHLVKFAADDFIECGLVAAILDHWNVFDTAPDVIETLVHYDNNVSFASLRLMFSVEVCQALVDKLSSAPNVQAQTAVVQMIITILNLDSAEDFTMNFIDAGIHNHLFEAIMATYQGTWPSIHEIVEAVQKLCWYFPTCKDLGEITLEFGYSGPTLQDTHLLREFVRKVQKRFKAIISPKS